MLIEFQNRRTIMKKNIGKTDKTFRLVFGTLIIAAGIYFKCWLGIIGVFVIIFAIIGYCPPYHLFGISTCSSKKNKKKSKKSKKK